MPSESRNRNGSVGVGYPSMPILLLVWSIVGTLAYGRHYLFDRSVGPGGVVFQLLLWMSCFYPWVALSPAVFRLEQRYPLGRAHWRRNLAVLSLGGVPVSYLGAEAAVGLNFVLERIFRAPSTSPDRWWAPPFADLFIHFLLYSTIAVAAYVIRNLIELRMREREAAQLALEKSILQSSLHQAEIETLRTRLNPHFLFNCLQNISVLTKEDPHEAIQMLTLLGDLLRTALRRDSGPETTLEEEISVTKRYIAIEKIRFSDKLTVLFDIAPESLKALVPTFLLQPLVENAILHGLRGRNTNGIVSISSTVASEKLMLVVMDNGVGLPGPDVSSIEPGVGLSSTCERLSKMYPERHSFCMRPVPEGGTEVVIEIPLQFQSTQTGVAADEPTSLVDRR